VQTMLLLLPQVRCWTIFKGTLAPQAAASVIT
jgi:hypothetical protein